MVIEAITILAGGASGDSVEELLLVVGQIIEGFPDDVPGDDPALATLTGYAQGIVDLPQGAGAICHRGANLGIGDPLAETDVHVELPRSMNHAVKGNESENDCQYHSQKQRSTNRWPSGADQFPQASLNQRETVVTEIHVHLIDVDRRRAETTPGDQFVGIGP